MKAVLLDLDDTLIDTAGLLLGPARLEAGAAMVAAGLPGTAGEAALALARLSRERPAGNPFELLAAEAGADPVLVGVAGWSAFFRRSVPPTLPLVPGAEPALRRWGAAGVARLLVTWGDPPTQHAKIVAAGLEALLDGIAFEPLAPVADKGRAFARLVAERDLDPARCAVLGDRPDAEIRAGNALGMFTVRIRRGEHETRDPASPEEEPRITVGDFPTAAAAADRHFARYG